MRTELFKSLAREAGIAGALRHCPGHAPVLVEFDYGNFVAAVCPCGAQGREFRIRFDGPVHEREGVRERAYEQALSAWNDAVRHRKD